MKFSNATRSIFLFLLSVIFMLLITIFESAFLKLSINTERIITFILLVLPALTGLYFGISALTRKEPKPMVAIIGILLNALFGLLNLSILFFAG